MIEDLDLPFFCISSNLSTYEENIWEKGLLWEAVRASCSVPILFPPFVHGGEIHIDGGIVNNFPSDVMRKKVGIHGTILGIDIGFHEPDPHRYNFPPSLTVGQVLKSFLKISQEKLDCIGLVEMILRINIMSSSIRYVQNCNEIDLLIRPNLERFRFSDFEKEDELRLEGHKEAMRKLGTVKK